MKFSPEHAKKQKKPKNPAAIVEENLGTVEQQLRLDIRHPVQQHRTGVIGVR